MLQTLYFNVTHSYFNCKKNNYENTMGPQEAKCERMAFYKIRTWN